MEMELKTNENFVATEPFPNGPPTIKDPSGLQSYVPHGLVKLKVLLDTRDGRYSAGDFVFVRSDLSQVYKVQQIGDLKFVLIEASRIDVFAS